jgi:hypothetical protein
MLLKFIRVDECWYVDLPEYIEGGGQFEDCLMVAGAPEFIESIIGKDKVSCTFEVSTDWFKDFDAILLKEKEDTDDNWGHYIGTIYNRKHVIDRIVMSVSMNVSLCPVNSWVWGDHPNSIFLKLKEYL